MITWLLKNIFWALDGLVRFAIHLFYGLIHKIASATLFQDYIYLFMGRIYAFLTIFMLFKLSISVVNYILNPDQFVDKTKGFGKLIQNVIIVIALIILVPTIFDWGYKLQCMVLNSGVLNSVITGVKNKKDGEELTNICFNDNDSCQMSSEEENEIDEQANMLTYSIMSGFVYSSGNVSSDDFIPADVSGVKGSPKGQDGKKTCAELVKSDGYIAASNCLFHYKTMTNSNDNTYLFLISTVCLGFIAYIFLIFTIDISIRTVKLSFLQLMAPIPIISRIDPSSGKSGMFGKWVKECTSTYLSLFVRLGAVFFGVDLIKQVISSKICADNTFVQIFIILGILAFAKQLPQFIENLIPGFKMGGDGLSLKKKLAQIPGSKTLGNTAQTLYRKTLAGLDARKNGQTFANGWRRVEGTDPISKWRKNWEGYHPYSAQTRKNWREGSEEIKTIDTKWNKGQEAANKLGDDWQNVLDGKAENKDSYVKIFKNEPFISSKMNLDREDEKLKKIRQENAAKQAAGTLTADDAKRLEDQEKKVAGLQKVHDSMRKMYSQDAATEDAYKFYKYNATNPANLTQTREQPKSTTTTTMQNEPNDDFVQSVVNEVTGISRPKPSEHGAPTAENSLMAELAQQQMQQDFMNQTGMYSSNNDRQDS